MIDEEGIDPVEYAIREATRRVLERGGGAECLATCDPVYYRKARRNVVLEYVRAYEKARGLKEVPITFWDAPDAHNPFERVRACEGAGPSPVGR